MPFSVNVLTSSGVELIAGATAANRLIFTRIRCTESAMTRQEAESADNADFDMDDGDIISASAQDNVARVVGAIRAQSSYTAKTFGLCARLEGDASDRVFAVLSDPDRGIPLPGPVGGVPTAAVSVAFQFAFTADASAIVNVTSAGAVAFHDLDRFVSAHKAGDAEAGEYQDIYGQKVFQGGVILNSGAAINSASSDQPLNINTTYTNIYSHTKLYNELEFTANSPAIRFDNKAHVYGGVIFHGGLETGGGDIDTGIGTVYCGTLSVGNTINFGDDDITYARGSHALYISGNVIFTCQPNFICNGNIIANNGISINGSASVNTNLTVTGNTNVTTLTASDKITAAKGIPSLCSNSDNTISVGSIAILLIILPSSEYGTKIPAKKAGEYITGTELSGKTVGIAKTGMLPSQTGTELGSGFALRIGNVGTGTGNDVRTVVIPTTAKFMLFCDFGGTPTANERYCVIAMRVE